MNLFTRQGLTSLLFAVAVGLAAVGCRGDDNPSGGDSYNGGDNNGGVGGSVPLEKWMTKNLDVETADSWCYGDDPANCDKYGRLYTWEAAQVACQSIGKRLPTNQEWDALLTAAGGSSTAGKKLKSTSGWNNNGNGTNDYGFSALPAGLRYSHGGFGTAGDFGFWWTATEDGSKAYYRTMYSNYDYVYVLSLVKSNAVSARCVAD
ncbi:MAG: hypothetical protein LBC59_09875 [Chitinispirillales bacterium]|jgi:uncharacterized protein (TIGR02145 family)|nr:hypothetical protein [Chitinispirillales bacterium]